MLDENIVHSKRFMIMTVLFIFREITESELSKATGVSWGSLSTHLTRLEKVGYVERRKAITKKGVRTVVKITKKGYNAYKNEVKKLKGFIDNLTLD